jgi:hypothetical protein
VVPGDASPVRVGDRREVLPAHCCATMNLHRSCVAVRGRRVEAVWPVRLSAVPGGDVERSARTLRCGPIGFRFGTPGIGRQESNVRLACGLRPHFA